MIQEISVYIIIILVIIYSVFTVIKRLRTKPKSVCEDCAGCGIKKEMMKKGKLTTTDCSYTPVKK